MRLAASALREWSDETLTFVKQLGVDEVVFNFNRTGGPPGDKRWEYLDLLQLRMRCQDAGLKIACMENLPRKFYDKAVLGLPGRDEQIENCQATIRHLGAAGLHLLSFNWHPHGVWRTSRTTPSRGGAKVTSFDAELVKDAPLSFDREYSEEEMWANFTYFMKAVLPVAEEAGVKLALHPDDPPMPNLGGCAQLFINFAAFRRALEIADSPNFGMDFCQGCWAEMAETDVYEAIRYFVPKGKIFYIHFRNVDGTVPKFNETFINQGYVDMFRAMKLYKELGFDGFFVDDHVPGVAGDTEWGHRSRAYAMGYIQALLDVVKEI